ncbi:MAG: hypothetical protein LBD84_07030 [Campylobacteraceae bacterium]|jgi:Ribonuclease G/E|nr:hypothetical protein [Campylobacteraceae bacterium]
MGKIIAALAITAVTIITLFAVIYARGNQIELLGAQLNASMQAYTLCEQKSLTIQSSLVTQNKAIEAIRIDSEKAYKELLGTHEKSVKKWENAIKTAKNATCEEQLKEVDALHYKFYKERN